MGGYQFWIVIKIIGYHVIPIPVFDLIEMKGHWILAVVEVVDREDQFVLEPAPGLAQMPVQGKIQPVVTGKPVIVPPGIDWDLVVVVVVIPCGCGKRGAGHVDEIAGKGNPGVYGPRKIE